MAIRRWIAGLLGLIFVASVPTISGAAAAVPVPGDLEIAYRDQSISTLIVRGEGEASELSPEAAEDLAEVRSSEPGYDFTEEELATQGEFEALVTAISLEHADIYSTAGFLHDQEADAWIAFTSDPPASIVDRIRKLPLTVEVRTGVPATETELERTSGIAIGAVADSGWDVGSIGSTVAPDGLSITVEYELREPRTEEERRQALEPMVLRVLANAFPGGVPVPITLVPYSDSVADFSVSLFGGGQLRNASNNSAACTAGFTGTRSGIVGVSTARHCPDALRFGMNAGSIQFVGVASQTPGGNWIDLQWHKAIFSTTATAKFRATAANVYRYVDVASDPVIDSSVCHWGQTSGYSCSTVHATNTCYKPANLTYCGLAATNSFIDQAGDSGGPWFFGTEARGIHAGSKIIDGARRSLMTKISMMSTYLHASVLRQ